MNLEVQVKSKCNSKCVAVHEENF